jgi:hypothetical protein
MWSWRTYKDRINDKPPLPAAVCRVRDFGAKELAMRKRLLFVLSVAMLVGGLYLLAVELPGAGERHGLIVLIGITLVALGAYLLWADFIAPALGTKTKQ